MNFGRLRMAAFLTIVCRAGVLIALQIACTCSGEAREFRGLWVDAFGPGFLNSNEVAKLVRDCHQYNFNAVLVEMRRRADAFYIPKPPNPDPRTTALTNDFDALAEIIALCHNATPRIEVHCWLVSHLIWSWDKKPPPQKRHVFNLRPEYLSRDSIGQTLLGIGYYLDPGNPEANEAVHRVAVDIVRRYDIDGLHWDYCRYPNRDSGFGQRSIRRYNEEFGLKGEPEINDPQFCEWRRRQVTDFLRWVNADLLAIKPNLVISVAVFAHYPDAYGYRFQDWAAWNREGIVDICMPMNFSADNQRIFFPRTNIALTNQGCRYVYIGQAGYMNRMENTLTQLNYVREKGFLGTVFYSYRNPNEGKSEQDATLAYLKEHFQPRWAQIPDLPWKRTKGIMKGVVTRDGTGVYNALVSINTTPQRVQRTEPHGSYAFFQLDPGTYAIEARVNGSEANSKTVEVLAGQVMTMDFDLSSRTP